MSQKLALFDVDKTIIFNDSMFSFLLYGLKKKPASLHWVFLAGLYSVLYKLNLMSAEHAKSAFFGFIKYLDEKDLKQFFDTKLKPRIYSQALKEMRYRKQEGYHILLVTASPAAYMKYFNELNEVDSVIGTELTIKEGRYTGTIKGNNCKGEEKVVRIKHYLAEKKITPDYNNSCAYSDSLSDMPMLTLVKHSYLINRKDTAGCEGLIWSF
ncbi:HAD family hydrolase [Paenibacillus sp. BR2-3]|uniref:HAD family hydrolase n=1 Tax=Paenibacillus sp. BR2-3 TaxID=3048494 RepID=UPI003977CE77